MPAVELGNGMDWYIIKKKKKTSTITKEGNPNSGLSLTQPPTNVATKKAPAFTTEKRKVDRLGEEEVKNTTFSFC